MKKLLLTLCLTAVAFAAVAQTRGVFKAEYSTKDIQGTFGWMSPINQNDGPVCRYLSVGYTANFWRSIAWKVGFQYIENKTWCKGNIGLPLGIAYRPGIQSWEDSIASGVGGAISSSVIDGLSGHPTEIVGDLIWHLGTILFRRTEFYLGVTPGYYIGQQDNILPGGVADRQPFSLTGDVGMILSIPIWHLSLNVTPAYHYSFTHNEDSYSGTPMSHYFSIGVGVGWLF